MVVVAVGNFVVVVSVAIVPLIVVVVAAEIVAVVAAAVVVGVAVVDTAEAGGIDMNWLIFVAGLNFPEIGIVLYFWLVLVYFLEIPVSMIPVVAAEVGLGEST